MAIIVCIALSTALFSKQAVAEADSSASLSSQRQDIRGIFPWDDTIKPLSRPRVLTPYEQDKLDARILFSIARDMERRSKLEESVFGPEIGGDRKNKDIVKYTAYQKKLLIAEALKNYQRASRLDPNTITFVRIVEMACLLERYDLADRYVEEMFYYHQPVSKIEPMLLRQLASGLANIGDIDAAYKLYKPILQNLKNRFDPQAVVLNFEGAKYAYAVEDYRQAADSFEFVYRLIKTPEEFNITPRMIDILEVEKPDTLRLVADAFLMDNRYDRADLFFEMADKLNKNAPLLAYHKARIAMAQKDYSAAKSYLDEALKGDLSGEGKEPIILLFDLAKQLNQMDYAELTLKTLADKVRLKIESLEKKKRLSYLVKKTFVNMDYHVWDYYCVHLADQNKKDEAIRNLKRFYDVNPNMPMLRLIVRYQLESKLFSDAFDSMAYLYKTSGGLNSILSQVQKFLEDEDNYKQFLSAATELQKKALEDGSHNGMNIENRWSVFHAGAVAQVLIYNYLQKASKNEATRAEETIENSPQSPKVTAIGQFVNYALAKAQIPRYVPKSKNKVTSVLAKATEFVTGKKDDSEEDELVLPPGAFNGRSLVVQWGKVLLQDLQYKSAIEAFETGKKWCVSQKEIDGLCNYYISGALALLKRENEALNLIDECLKRSPEDIDFLSRKAWLLLLSDKINEAEALYEEILANSIINNVEDDNVSIAETREMLASVYDRRTSDPTLSKEKKLEYEQKSEELMEKNLDSFPGSALSLNDLSYFWADRGKNLHRAEKMAIRAVELVPDNAAFLDTLGWAQFRLKKYDEAIASLKRSVELDPDPNNYNHLGDVYAAVNNMVEAKNCWEKALEGFKDPRFMKQFPFLKNEIQQKLDSVHPPSK